MKKRGVSGWLAGRLRPEKKQQDGQIKLQTPKPPTRQTRFTLTLIQRLTISLILLTSLVIAASLIGVWFANAVESSIAATRQTAEQTVRLSEVQRSWLAAVGVLDTLSVTSTDAQKLVESRQQMQNRLEQINRQLLTLEAAPLGISPEKVSANREITASLRQLVDEISQVTERIFELTGQNRWGAALQLRQSQLAGLQTRLDENLKALNQNLQDDLAAQRLELAALVRQARLYTLIAIGLAIFLAIVTGLLARRSIMRPLDQLNNAVRRIAASSTDAAGGGHTDWGEIQPLPQRDELGQLSSSIASMADQLRASYAVLEERVAERTASLERRSSQLQVAAQVARDIAAARNLEDLLNRAVNLIRDRFGFYHAGIFLISASRNEQISLQPAPAEGGAEGMAAVLRAATGDAGRRMLASGHSLPLSGAANAEGSSGKNGAASLVGAAAQTGQARIALDTAQDPLHHKNPLLPETRAEAAIPLKIGERVIGVLDVQSRTAGAFDAESLEILQIIADQLAIAIQNARLLAEVQQNLAELEAAYGRYDRRAWEDLSQARQTVGYEFVRLQAEASPAASPATIPGSAAAAASAGLTPALAERAGGEEAAITPIAAGAPEPGSAPLRVPLRVRGQQIGIIEAWPAQAHPAASTGPDAGGESTPFSDAEVYLLASLSNRLSQIIESARLFEEAQQRLAREALINRITSSITRSLDTSHILQTAALQLADLPGIAQASVSIDRTEPTSPKSLPEAGADNDAPEGGETGGSHDHRP